MERVVDRVLVLFPEANGAAVELADGGDLTYACGVGALAEHVGTQVDLEGTLSGSAIRVRRTLYCEDCLNDRRVDRAACERLGAASMVCVPLRRGTQSLGVLKITASRARAFSDEDVAALATLADFISAVVAGSSDVARAVAALASRGGARRGEGLDGARRFVADLLRPGLADELEVRRKLEQVLAESDFRIVCQPIVEIDTGALLGVEALTRFPRLRAQPADAWFADAERVGLGIQLQLAVVKMALALLPGLPESTYMFIKLGRDALASQELPDLLRSTIAGRIVLELTEHLRVEDYPRLRFVLTEMRSIGVRLALDDAGAGLGSLVRIVDLAPDLIKLDRQLTRGIDHDPVRRALAHALVDFAHETGAGVIAEGIHTVDELEAVRGLGIRYGQGYLIARPQPAAAIRQQYTLRTYRLPFDRS